MTAAAFVSAGFCRREIPPSVSVTCYPCCCQMNMPRALEWTEDFVSHWRLQHALSSRSHSRAMSTRRLLQDVRDGDPLDAVAYHPLGLISAKLDQPDNMSPRDSRTPQFHDAVDLFLDR